MNVIPPTFTARLLFTINFYIYDIYIYIINIYILKMTYPFKFNSSLLYEQGKKMTLNVVPVSTHTRTRKHLRAHVNSLSYKQKDIHGNALFCIITCSIKCWSCMCFYFCSCICSGAEHLRECVVKWTLWYTESQDMCVFE